MNKTLIFTSAATSFFKLPEVAQERLTEALRVYGLTGVGDVKRMKGVDALRLRDGDFRIVFRETADGIVILAAGHRRDIYR